MGTPFKMKGFGGFGNSPLKQNAPGTPGEPGYEPRVKHTWVKGYKGPKNE